MFSQTVDQDDHGAQGFARLQRPVLDGNIVAINSDKS